MAAQPCFSGSTGLLTEGINSLCQQAGGSWSLNLQLIVKWKWFTQLSTCKLITEHICVFMRWWKWSPESLKCPWNEANSKTKTKLEGLFSMGFDQFAAPDFWPYTSLIFPPLTGLNDSLSLNSLIQFRITKTQITMADIWLADELLAWTRSSLCLINRLLRVLFIQKWVSEWHSFSCQATPNHTMCALSPCHSS